MLALQILLRSHQAVSKLELQPCWMAPIAFRTPLIKLTLYSALRFAGQPSLSEVIVTSSKRFIPKQMIMEKVLLFLLPVCSSG